MELGGYRTKTHDVFKEAHRTPRGQADWQSASRTSPPALSRTHWPSRGLVRSGLRCWVGVGCSANVARHYWHQHAQPKVSEARCYRIVDVVEGTGWRRGAFWLSAVAASRDCAPTHTRQPRSRGRINALRSAAACCVVLHHRHQHSHADRDRRCSMMPCPRRRPTRSYPTRHRRYRHQRWATSPAALLSHTCRLLIALQGRRGDHRFGASMSPGFSTDSHGPHRPSPR